MEGPSRLGDEAPLRRIRVTVRCYAELNDFLPRQRRQLAFEETCAWRSPVKDFIESLGIPHTEIDVLLVNGEPSDLERTLEEGDRVAVYPVFEAFDVSEVSRVRPRPLREVRFVADVHLGRLAAWLRLAGFDTAYWDRATDADLVRRSRDEHRILLTRDQALLKRSAITHGSYVRATDPESQLAEVASRFHLAALARPFTRCTRCNTPLEPASPASVAERVPPASRACFDRFLHCPGCGRIYWEGSHYRRLLDLVERVCGPSGDQRRF